MATRPGQCDQTTPACPNGVSWRCWQRDISVKVIWPVVTSRADLDRALGPHVAKPARTQRLRGLCWLFHRPRTNPTLNNIPTTRSDAPACEAEAAGRGSGKSPDCAVRVVVAVLSAEPAARFACNTRRRRGCMPQLGSPKACPWRSGRGLGWAARRSRVLTHSGNAWSPRFQATMSRTLSWLLDPMGQSTSWIVPLSGGPTSNGRRRIRCPLATMLSVMFLWCASTDDHSSKNMNLFSSSWR